MTVYQEFSDIYDLLMKTTDYSAWADFYERLFARYRVTPELILDLGCGSGTLTKILADRGYDMTGIDSSCAMLNKAMAKGGNVLYLQQDMTEFELYGTMGAIISSLDCINYITNKEDLLQVFRLMWNYLDYDGVVIFDINSAYKLREILGGHCYTYDDDGVFYTWESFYDEDTKLCDFELTFFVHEHDGLYRRIEESQTERAWETEEIRDLLAQANFCEIECFGDKTLSAPTDREERIFFAARKRERT